MEKSKTWIYTKKLKHHLNGMKNYFSTQKKNINLFSTPFDIDALIFLRN